MSVIVYFGSTPTSSQTVNTDLAAKSINLCRESPSEMKISSFRAYDHPNYAHYTERFPMYLASANQDRAVAIDSNNSFYGAPNDKIPKFCSSPKIIFTFGEKKSVDVINQIVARFNASETTARGKPALTATLSRQQVRDLVRDYNPITSTEFSVGVLNLDAYKVYLRLWAIVRSICKVHQYPLVAGDGTNLNKFVETGIQYDGTTMGVMSANKNHVYVSTNTSRWVHCNLPTKIDQYHYYSKQKSHLPNDSGLIFPFERLLASDDHEVLTLFLQRRGFFGLLADDGDSALKAAVFMQEGWKNLKLTLWGKELSHILHGIMLAFDTGAGIKIIQLPTGGYGGFLLYGGHFKITLNSTTFVPQTFATVQSSFDDANPHSKNLLAILDKISFPDDITRQGAIPNIQKMYDLGVLIRQYGYNDNDRDRMMDLSKYLAFPSDIYLSINPQNVVRVLDTISSGAGEELVPLHYLALFEKNRTRRVLSAFGATGPSFIIEGGRTMELTGNFSFKKKTNKGNTEVNVTRMFAAVVSLEKCWTDFEKVISTKAVITPAGTPLAHRASARSTIREFEGNFGTEVLTSLRKAAKIAVSGTPTADNKKRKAEDEEEEKRTKKARATFDI